MKPYLAVLTASLFLVAACDRPPQPRTDPAAGAGPSAPVQPLPQTGPASSADKAEATPPAQGQVDSKHPPQQKDFQQKGDGAGPKPGG